MLQLPMAAGKNLDTDQDECRCPGYYKEQCEAEAAQGCIWSDAGESNEPWCQCGAAPEPVCCEAMTPSCLACQAGISEDEYCARRPGQGGCPPVDPPVTLPPPVDDTPYDCETCRQMAEDMGLEIGGVGFTFEGTYTPGCYTYTSGQYKCHAYCGTGTVAEAAEPIVHATRARLDGGFTVPEQCVPDQEPTPPPTCPFGWVQVGQPGADIGGCGLQSCDQRYNTPTEAACAESCDAMEECDGFNFAPVNGDHNHEDMTVCTLYNSNTPTGTWHGSAGFVQVFCVRENAGSTSECADDVVEKCQGNTPCIDLREAANHHHLMWLNPDGTAHVDGEAGGIGAGDSRTWTCEREGDGVGLVGTWNCPGFYSNIITITSDFADDFTPDRDNVFIHVCALPEAEHTEYGQPCTEGTATIAGIPVCTVASNDGNSHPWVMFGDIDHQTSNFVASQVTGSPTTSGLHNGDSAQVGTFSTGALGSPGYSLDIGQFCSGGSCTANFDLMIQYGDSDVFSFSLDGYSTTNGGFINNGHTAEGVVIGEHGLWGSKHDHPNGYYATFCAYNGGCGIYGHDFWAFSSHGVYPNHANSVVCGMYYGQSSTPWKNCPSGDNGHRMRYYIRSPDLEVTFPQAD